MVDNEFLSPPKASNKGRSPYKGQALKEKKMGGQNIDKKEKKILLRTFKEAESLPYKKGLVVVVRKDMRR